MLTTAPTIPAHLGSPATFQYRSKAGIGMLRHNLNMDLVFPIRDEISAWLMCLKAELLYDAGIISDAELDSVIERVAAAIAGVVTVREPTILIGPQLNSGRGNRILKQLPEPVGIETYLTKAPREDGSRHSVRDLATALKPERSSRRSTWRGLRWFHSNPHI
jgi:hypothetical protein